MEENLWRQCQSILKSDLRCIGNAAIRYAAKRQMEKMGIKWDNIKAEISAKEDMMHQLMVYVMSMDVNATDDDILVKPDGFTSSDIIKKTHKEFQTLVDEVKSRPDIFRVLNDPVMCQEVARQLSIPELRISLCRNAKDEVLQILAFLSHGRNDASPATTPSPAPTKKYKKQRKSTSASATASATASVSYEEYTPYPKPRPIDLDALSSSSFLDNVVFEAKVLENPGSTLDMSSDEFYGSFGAAIFSHLNNSCGNDLLQGDVGLDADQEMVIDEVHPEIMKLKDTLCEPSNGLNSANVQPAKNPRNLHVYLGEAKQNQKVYATIFWNGSDPKLPWQYQFFNYDQGFLSCMKYYIMPHVMVESTTKQLIHSLKELSGCISDTEWNCIPFIT